MKKYQQWVEAQGILKAASQWVAMYGKRAGYQNDVFTLSVSSPIKFDLCGQQSCGGQNYWPSSKEFNEAFAEVVKKHFVSLAEEALQILKIAEQTALIACDEEVKSMQSAIQDAQEVQQ